MYQIKHVSPSQIKTWRTCQRKWWYEKVAGIRQETTPNQQLGTDVHSILEHYVENGVVIPDNFAGQIAKAALPMVNMQSKCEHQFDIPLVDGILATGRIDFTAFGVIEDLKTTSSMRYAKTSEELKTDPQAIMYLWAAQRDPALEFFGPISKFAHLIVETKVPHKTRRVECVLSEEEIEEGISLIKSDALEMKSASGKEVDDIDYNLDACAMYGGCHLHGECYKKGIFWASKRKDGEMNPLLEKMRAAKKAKKEETNPAPEAASKASVVQKGMPAPEPEAMPENTESSAINPPDGVPNEVKLDPPVTKAARKKSVVPEWISEHAGKSVLSLKKAEAISVYETVKKVIMEGRSSLSTDKIRSIMSVLDWSTDGATAADCKAKARELVDALPKDFVPEAKEPEAKEPEASDLSKPRLKGWLFVGCKPSFQINGMVQMDDMLSPIRDAVQKGDSENRHWMVINDYGVNGSHRVCSALKILIDQGTDLPGVLIADYRLPGHSDAVAILRPYYNVVEAI